MTQIQEHSQTFTKRFNIAKILLYMFYGHLITTSLNDHIIESLNRIAVDLKGDLSNYFILIYGLVNIITCVFMIRCLFLDHNTNKPVWAFVWSLFFASMMFYKMDFGYKNFVHYPRTDQPKFLDLKFCNDHFVMRDLKLTKLIFVTFLELIAFISFLVIKAYLTSRNHLIIKQDDFAATSHLKIKQKVSAPSNHLKIKQKVLTPSNHLTIKQDVEQIETDNVTMFQNVNLEGACPEGIDETDWANNSGYQQRIDLVKELNRKRESTNKSTAQKK